MAGERGGVEGIGITSTITSNDGVKGQKSGARKLKAHGRKLAALKLRRSGATFEQIAARLGVSKSAAYKCVQTALRETLRESADELRTLELARLDRLYFGLRTQLDEGDWKAAKVALSIIERRAKLLGLDAPIKAQVAGVVAGAVVVDQAAEVDQLAAVAAILHEVRALVPIAEPAGVAPPIGGSPLAVECVGTADATPSDRSAKPAS